jgi:hypothetical protein
MGSAAILADRLGIVSFAVSGWAVFIFADTYRCGRVPKRPRSVPGMGR